MQNSFDFVILGSGLSGLMLAYKMSQDTYFNDKKIAIIDKDIKNKNDRTWCFWAKPQHEFSDVVYKQWFKAFVGNENFKKSYDLNPYTYQMIRSSDFYKKILKTLKQKSNINFFQDEIISFKNYDNKVEIIGKKSSYHANQMFNSFFDNKTLMNQKQYAYLKQHFVGWFIKTDQDCFDENEVKFMDFDISQNGNTRFMYVLPLSKNEALVEYTLFSEDLLPFDVYEDAIKNYLIEKKIENYQIIEKEYGNIPMTCFPFHKQNSSNVLFIGTAGGWTKASTGFTFSNTIKYVDKLINHIKKDKPLNQFYQPSKFWLYDLIFLEVLRNNNHRGSEIFIKLFKNNKTHIVLDFLDCKTSLSQELKIFTTVPSFLFTKNLFLSFYKILKNR
jgi:lycopene beta-cyclase